MVQNPDLNPGSDFGLAEFALYECCCATSVTVDHPNKKLQDRQNQQYGGISMMKKTGEKEQQQSDDFSKSYAKRKPILNKKSLIS